jgi:RHS repeat-associated protein
VEEYDTAGNAKGSYVYGLDLIGKLQGNQPSFYHVDGLGSTRLLTNGLGTVTDTYSYDAFGNSIVSTGGSNNPYLFAGEQRDVETGLDYLRARYYDPFVGRFVSADAYEGTLNDPMSLHDYQYAHANPVVFTDPSGYFSIQEFLSNLNLQNILSGMQAIGFTSAKAKLFGSSVLTGSAFNAFVGGAVGGWTRAINSMENYSIFSGKTMEEARMEAALQGAVEGAIGGAILGGASYGLGALIGPALAATLGNVGGGIITGATSGAGGMLTLKLFNYATRREEKFELSGFVRDIGYAGALGAIGGLLFIRAGHTPPNSPQQVAHWQPSRYPVTPESQLRQGDWVMVGGKGILNYLASGIWMMRYRFKNAFTTTVPGATLSYPPGFLDAWKGLIGQRIYTNYIPPNPTPPPPIPPRPPAP